MPVEKDPLQSQLRASLHGAATGQQDCEALKARVIAQWEQRHGPWSPGMALAGAASSRSGGHAAWRWAALALLVLSAAVVVGTVWRGDALPQELLQPDVLSQLGLGEF